MNTLVFGIDIAKGNVRSAFHHPRFSLVRVADSRIVSEERDVSIPRLFRLMHAERPAILAVDSVQEIAADDAGLFAFIERMPSATKLVQVTGGGGRMVSLPVLAGRYNLRFDKTNPMEEAKVSALVASFGGGYEVLGCAGTTTVTVSRARSPGRGGWSQNRYVRKMHGGVKVRSREIEAKLEEAGLVYTAAARAAFGGTSRTTFVVNAPRDAVPVSSGKTGDVQVKVIPMRRENIDYVPLTRRPSYVIAGVDPGTTVGLAVFDLDGNLLHLASVRALSPAELIAEISRVGNPLIIATDKAEMPAGVEKIRRAFSAVGWTPKKDILIKEKYALADGYPTVDDHQRDSLAAAVMAYRSYQPKFDNLRRRLPPGMDIDVVRAGIVRGYSLEQIEAKLKGDEAVPAFPAAAAQPAPVLPLDEKDREIARLEEMVAKLRKLAGSLSDDLEQKDKAVSSLQRRPSLERNERSAAVLSSEEIISRDRELEQVKKALRKEERRSKNLRQRLERMKHYVALQAGDGCLALKVLQLFARDHLKSMDDEMGVNEDDILYVLKIDGWGRSVLRDTADAKVRAVIFPRITYERAKEQHLIDEFRDLNIPALSGAALSPRVKGKIGVVDEEAFCRAMEEWDAAQAVYLKEKQSRAIHGMVKEYQVERQREVLELGIDPQTFEFNQKPPAAQPAPPAPKKAPAVRVKPAPEAVSAASPVPAAVPEKKPELKEPNASAVLFGVLAAYRDERKKELEKNDG
ncbi:MAG: DUF460 domain-containing protein [Methanocorpusculum sp.]|nr:DUF460 domain-containing protein [Methanocorpusculum sp.]